MRQVWVWAASFLWIPLLSACGGKPVVAASPEDVLVLEVGGDQASLRASLVALGRTVDPGHILRPRPYAPQVGDDLLTDRLREPSPGYDSPGDYPPDADRKRSPQSEPVVDKELPEPPESPWVIVKLRKDETPIHIAKRCLGDGRRFGEVMAWNGWSEQDARRLKVGIDVKIKRSELRPVK